MRLESVILLVLEVGLLLLPLGPFPFKTEQLLRQFCLGGGALAIELFELKLVGLALFLDHSLVLSVAGLLLGLESLKLFGKAAVLLGGFLEALLERSLL